MGTTRTLGITVDTEGFRTINKEHRGERIFARLGLVCQEQAERRLAQELERLEWESERRKHARPLFSDCCNRFLLESKYKRTKATIAWHVAILWVANSQYEGIRLCGAVLRALAVMVRFASCANSSSWRSTCWSSS